MLVSVHTCSRCGRSIVVAPIFTGSTEEFEADFRIGGDLPEDARWYPVRGRGMVNGSMRVASDDERYWVQHQCHVASQYNVSRAFSLAGKVEAISASRRPASEASLPEGAVLTFSWTTGFAHASWYEDGYAMCGVRADAPVSDRERERVVTMPMCTTCWSRCHRHSTSSPASDSVAAGDGLAAGG